MSNKKYRRTAFNTIYEYIGKSNMDEVILINFIGELVRVDPRDFKLNYEEYHEPEKRTRYINIYRHSKGKITIGSAVGRGEADHRAESLKLYGHELIGRTKVEIVEGHFDD